MFTYHIAYVLALPSYMHRLHADSVSQTQMLAPGAWTTSPQTHQRSGNTTRTHNAPPPRAPEHTAPPSIRSGVVVMLCCVP